MLVIKKVTRVSGGSRDRGSGSWRGGLGVSKVVYELLLGLKLRCRVLVGGG
jgi:hypothetical protein